ncbi:hypothetical protein ACJMK2_024885, partial [Sinanodonta woodiana]
YTKDNATVLIKNVPTDGRNSLEIYFTGLTKQLHNIHMIIIVPKANNTCFIQVSKNYSGRIKDININNGSLSFLLVDVNFIDSGNCTVFEGDLEKGKQNILVTRLVLNGQVSKSMILPFLCNNTNTSSIKIGKSHAFDQVDYIIYDVASKNCTYTKVTLDYKVRNFNCVLNGTSFNLILEELTWTDKGIYTAWDDQGLLLDALFLGIADSNISTPRGTFSTDCSCHREQNGKLIWLLVSAAINVLLLACLAIIAVRKLRHRK